MSDPVGRADDRTPSQFYTGLVAELYGALRSADPDPEPLIRFVGRYGTPALELGCGDGDPLLALRRRGIEIEGLDSSADMLDRCRTRAAAMGVDVVLHHSTMEDMDLGRTFRSIVLAGPTFVVLADDDHARRALERIALHLEPDGAALVPLFVPEPVGRLGLLREAVLPSGATVRCSSIAAHRDDDARVQVVTLRYEREPGAVGAPVEVVEREWLLHWYSPASFTRLAEEAGLRVSRLTDLRTREPVTERATEFVAVLARA